ncbi:aminoglycoside phosphotransferase family protein [Cohnella sp. LGH]|uniref:phosphotransferase family protein n=1 Tax=Cohnella sp. LGH TaxID=1619153 RepID=UPI001ADC3353|nr:aminoglycoside phosphotransferase family protein [Cohnella sp. LGH]QTH40793.1 aminoglycoside phosphotransferase family protein [Cohnella sp. LGH]
MILGSANEVRAYLLSVEWLTADEPSVITELSGGVSCQVWKIVTGRGRWVLKQALPQLKVQSEWFSDVARIEREQEAMLALYPLLDVGQVPSIVYQDKDAYLYMMTCAPEGAVTWKSQLQEGHFRTETAEAVGRMMRRMHVASRSLPMESIDSLQDMKYFDELRIDPFHNELARKYPELLGPIEDLKREVTEVGRCFVHGDFSPKNILVAGYDEVILLDYEVGHWGNPVFDLAFCIGHLVLKGIAYGREEDARRSIEALLSGYGAVPSGLMKHLGLMLLARIDGKSPVEYITNAAMMEHVSWLGKQWLLSSSKEQAREVIAQGLGVRVGHGQN